MELYSHFFSTTMSLVFIKNLPKAIVQRWQGGVRSTFHARLKKLRTLPLRDSRDMTASMRLPGTGVALAFEMVATGKLALSQQHLQEAPPENLHSTRAQTQTETPTHERDNQQVLIESHVSLGQAAASVPS